jgi:hypothetical protein
LEFGNFFNFIFDTNESLYKFIAKEQGNPATEAAGRREQERKPPPNQTKTQTKKQEQKNLAIFKALGSTWSLTHCKPCIHVRILSVFYCKIENRFYIS